MSTPVVRVELKRADAAELLATDLELKDSALVRALLSMPAALKSAVLRRYVTQTVLWQQGDEGQSLGLVVGGGARVIARRDTDNAELGTVRKGDVLGESEVLLGSTKRRYSVVALEHVDVLEVPRASLLLQGAVPSALATELKTVQARRAKALDDLSDFLNRW